jgi:hypothetical protein
MPGRYRFPRPSRRLRQTRLEPRERQQKLESHDLPVNRRPVIAGDHGCLRCCQPPFDLHEGFRRLTRSCQQACRRVPGSTVLSVLSAC